jgi:hypothetical protein
VLFLIVSFLEVTKVRCSHQALSQRGSHGKQQVVVGGTRGDTKGGAIFQAEYIAKTRQGQKSETSAFTSQSEISRISTLSFLWCSFWVKHIAFILEIFLFSSQSSLPRPKASHVTYAKTAAKEAHTWMPLVISSSLAHTRSR